MRTKLMSLKPRDRAPCCTSAIRSASRPAPSTSSRLLNMSRSRTPRKITRTSRIALNATTIPDTKMLRQSATGGYRKNSNAIISVLRANAAVSVTMVWRRLRQVSR